MTFYWRSKDIPELRDVPTEDRREWWREAVTSSRTAGARWTSAIFVGAAVMLADNLHGNALMRYGGMIVVIGLVSLIYEIKYQQPRARRWLQANLSRQMARYRKLSAN